MRNFFVKGIDKKQTFAYNKNTKANKCLLNIDWNIQKGEYI